MRAKKTSATFFLIYISALGTLTQKNRFRKSVQAIFRIQFI